MEGKLTCFGTSGDEELPFILSCSVLLFCLSSRLPIIFKNYLESQLVLFNFCRKVWL